MIYRNETEHLLSEADSTRKLYAAIRMPMTRYVMHWGVTADEARACEVWLKAWRHRQQGEKAR